MNGEYLLDTSVMIALFASDPTVTGRLRNMREIFIPSIALGELYYGAYRSNQLLKNVAIIERFAASNVVLSCNADSARQYGEIKDRLRRKGHPIPENDIWIAAIALQHGLTLITRDAHFSAVEDLEVEMW